MTPTLSWLSLRCLALGAALPLVAAGQDPDSSRVAAPVVVRGDTLLVLTERFGPFTAAERAAAIQQRLRRFARSGDSVAISANETTDELLVGDNVLMTVTDADAGAAGVRRAELSAVWAAQLSRGLRQTGVLMIARIVLIGALWTLLASLVLALSLWGMGKVFPRLYATLGSWRGTRIRSLRFQRLELLSADRATDILIVAARTVRVAIVVTLLYFYVPLVLSFFPWTRPLADSILASVFAPLGRTWTAFIEFLPNVFVIAVIVVVTRYFLSLIHLLFGAVGRGTVTLDGFDRDWAEPTYKIVRFLVMVFALVVVFPYLPGSKSDAFKGVSLFLGVLFSLGSSSAIANVIAGVVLTYTRAFQLGDRVKIGETVGDVVAKTLLVTRIRTIKNVDVTVPNAMVLNSHVLNYTAMAKDRGLILHTGVTIGYDAPWRQVHELLIGAAAATTGILANPAPFVLQTSLDDFFVSYELNAYTDAPQVMAGTYSALHANIQDAFNRAGVEIMSPHYRAARDGNPMAIPAADLPADYRAPRFRVEQTGQGA